MDNNSVIQLQDNHVLLNEKHYEVTLHADILNILFKHKEEIYRKLIDLRGVFLIEHIAIKIIDPKNNMIIFSITPSVEYNLIVQGLWRHDKSFCPYFQKFNTFYLWNQAYSKKYFNEIKYMKETKHGFTCGFNLAKKVDFFHFIYSYATRSKNNELDEYYRSHVNDLFALGDYGYKLIRDIYTNYCHPDFSSPSVVNRKKYHARSFLKLIVNNK